MRRAMFFWALALACSASAAFAASDPLENAAVALTDWHLSGQNTFRHDNYHTVGYTASTLYPFESNQTYDEFRLVMDRLFSPYEFVSFSSAGVFADARARTSDQGFVAEDLRAQWEKGDGAVPFRLYGGDFTANLSTRTVQQNVKGAQLEIQPEIAIGPAEQRHSILGFWGMQQNDYRNLDLNRNVFAGASWLVDLARWGTWAAHYVHNFRQKDGLDRRLEADRSQSVWGLTYEKVFEFLDQRLGVEAETDYFHGDYDTYSNLSGFETDRSDAGYFLQLTGESAKTLDYGFRYEDYGNHYRPAGGIITPDRRTISGKAGMKIFSDYRLDGRAEWYKDRYRSDDPTDTQVQGVSLSGPLGNKYLPDLSFFFDTFRESVDGTDRFVDVHTWSYMGQLTATLVDDWSGRLGMNVREPTDEAFNYTTIQREISFDAGHPLSWGGAVGDIRPGMVYRLNSGINAGESFGPSLAVSLRGEPHSVYLQSQYLFDNDRSLFDQDLQNVSLTTGYAYTSGPHRVSVDCQMNNRNPFEYQKNTEDYRITFAYTFSFDKPVGVDPRQFSWTGGYSRPTSVLEDVSAEELTREMLFIRSLRPGMSLSDAEAFLKSEGLEAHATQGVLRVYETRIFHDAPWRQRLVLEEKDGAVQSVTYLIDLDPSQDPSRSQEVYETIRGSLLKRFGNPSADLHEGEFAAGYTAAVNSGSLLRVTDWPLEGRLLRMGLPVQFGRASRIEIRVASSLPDARTGRWGLDPVS